jgi:hypothetical protein
VNDKYRNSNYSVSICMVLFPTCGQVIDKFFKCGYRRIIKSLQFSFIAFMVNVMLRRSSITSLLRGLLRTNIINFNAIIMNNNKNSFLLFLPLSRVSFVSSDLEDVRNEKLRWYTFSHLRLNNVPELVYMKIHLQKTEDDQ